MRFHLFGENTNPVMLLIHGALTPWQIWQTQIDHFSRTYYVAAVVLDGHEEEEPSEFVSLEKEAAQIEAFCKQKGWAHVQAVCGISMGGAVANCLWCRQNLPIRQLVLDGAPLISCGGLLCRIMTSNYLFIIRKSRKRDPATLRAFSRDFLPEVHLPAYLRIADHMSEDTIRHMIGVMATTRIPVKSPDPSTKLLFIHGTKGNEILSKKSAHRMQAVHQDMQIHCCKGDVHCYKAIWQPSEWISIVEDFLSA